MVNQLQMVENKDLARVFLVEKEEKKMGKVGERDVPSISPHVVHKLMTHAAQNIAYRCREISIRGHAVIMAAVTPATPFKLACDTS